MPSDPRTDTDRSTPDVTVDFSHQGDTSAQPSDTISSSGNEKGDPSASNATAPSKDAGESILRKRIATYEIIDELGRGGMGVVYKAQELRLKRNVALKVILAGGHAGRVELARFQTEAEAVARLKHQNVVQIYEVGEHDGLPFLALEYCAGGCLEDRIDDAPLSLRESAELTATLSDAVEHAHQAGVIHRDIKPGNVLFDGDGTPKITDFGLAKQLGDDDSYTRTGSIMGSIGYMSPEQASGHTREVKAATDIYALGSVLYRLLAGRVPFEGSTDIETLHMVINAAPVPIRRLRPSCPSDLETICLKCLEKNPASRYARASELGADLRRFLNGEPIHARPATPLEQLINWARRNPLPSVVAVFGVVMLTVLTGILAGMTYRNYRMMQTIQQREMRVQELRGEILYLDELLTGSCFLASLTGEMQWEKRYRQHVPQLDSSLAEAIFLVPNARAELEQVGQANEQLIAVEGHAFELVREGRQSEAWELLNGEDYRKQKKAYWEGLVRFAQRLKEHSEQTVHSAYREAMAFLIAALCLGGLVVVILLVGVYSLVRALRLQSAATGRLSPS